MSKELRIFYKRMFSSNYFSSSSFDFNETRIVLINRYVPIIIKFDTTFYICIHYDGAQTAGAQTAGAQMSSRPNGGAQKSRTLAGISYKRKHNFLVTVQKIAHNYVLKG